jgi:hypothetical protein
MKKKSFKFNDTVKTTSGQPIVGAILQTHPANQSADVTSFRTGKLWEVPYEILKKISNKEADRDVSRLYHKLG